MSSSEVTFRGRSFEAPDSALEVWLRLLTIAIDGVAEPADWMSAAHEDWNDAATMGFGYGVIPDLDAFVTDEDRRSIVLHLCERALTHLLAIGDPIPAASLNQLGAGRSDSRFVNDVPAATFTRVADQFIALVRDAQLE